MPRFICTVPNTSAGQRAADQLRKNGIGEYEIKYINSLGDYLRRVPPGEGGALASAQRVDTMLPYTFHEIEIPEGEEQPTIQRLLRFHNDPRELPARGFIEAIEPNLDLELSAKLGLPFTLGGMHTSYLGQLNVGALHGAGFKGQSVRVAVIDTGAVSSGFVSDFYDLTPGASTTHPGPWATVDVNGHGTAMAELIHEVAPDAEIQVIRICDGNPKYFHVLAAVALAVFDCHAHVINMSLGFKDWGGRCGTCGTDGVTRSIALGRMMEALLDLDPAKHLGYVQPVYVAATGNKGSSTGFDYPAGLDYVVPVGSVDSTNTRSSFSNYGQAHSLYVLAPGGQEVAGGAVTEHVGSGSMADCFGTSVSTAYVSGIMALLFDQFGPTPLQRNTVLNGALSRCAFPSGAAATEYGNGIISL